MCAKKVYSALAVLAGLLVAGSVGAADLQVDAAGQLTGAKNVRVNVGGTDQCYDVTFTANNPSDNTYPDGSCQDVFSGCDEPTDFAFTNQAAAESAARALLDQVFLDTPEGDFDSQSALTKGCTDVGVCTAIFPFSATLQDLLIAETFNYSNAVGQPDATLSRAATTIDADMGRLPSISWVVFEPCAPQHVPEQSLHQLPSFRPERADFCRAGDFPGKISADFGRVNSDTSDRRTSLYKIVV